MCLLYRFGDLLGAYMEEADSEANRCFWMHEEESSPKIHLPAV